MNKLIHTVLVALICTLTLNISAWADNYTSAIMIGSGATKDEAIQDAIRNAVETATGVFVYSTTEVSNFALVKDKIVTASKGYVKDFKVLEETKNEGIFFVKLDVSVDTASIKSVIKREIKTTTYDDALKDYATITSIVERNKKYAEILKSISSRPIDELYQVNFTGYEIVDAGTTSADVILKFRIAQNRFLWDIYYDTLKQISNNGSYVGDNHIIINYNIVKEHAWGFDIAGERLHLHKDFNDYIIKPRQVTIAYKLLDMSFTLKPFCLYDKYINNREDGRSKWVYVNDMASKKITKDSVGYFIGSEGFEYKVRHTIKNIEDLKKLPFVKVTLKDVAQKPIDYEFR
ncbi:MAG: hypothetical protein HY026_09825 [Deltaproteobacteria bacterium]|nr:hypothetical protein [Deltaproteobacteria bacterium]